MAHEISLIDQVVTQMGTARAWHGLDKQFELNGLTDSELAERIKMLYEVRCYQMGRMVGDNFVATPNDWGVFADGNPNRLTSLSEYCDLVQPHQFAAFGNMLAKKMKALIVAAGTLREKRLGFITLDLGTKVSLIGGDEIKQYLTLTISWDGSYRFAVAAMDYRTVCANTYPSPDCQAIWEARKVHGFSLLPVSSPFDPDQVSDFIVDQYAQKVAVNKQKYSDVIGNLVDTNFDGARDKNLLRFASIMADGKSTLNRIVDLHEETQSASFLDRCLAATIDKDAWDNVRTNGLSNVGTRIVAETLDGLGSDLESASGTLWGMLNGYTFYTDHLAGNLPGQGKKASEESRQEDVLFGNWNAQKENAMLLLSAIANTPSVR